MKKILFLTAILLANISCQEEEINTQVDSTLQPKNRQVVQITEQGEIIPMGDANTRSSVKGELALQFISESDYQSAIAEIGHMNDKERLAYTNNFISLQELAIKADEELDEIGNAATSEADFRKKYAQYVEKYNGKLITNKYDPEDLTLYVPDGDNLSTYLINENRKVVIGNKIKEISLNNDMGATDKVLFAAKASSNEAGGKHIHNEAQKTTYGVTLQQNMLLRVHIGFQKKRWYGWKRDNHRDAYYYLEASPFQYNYWIKPAKDAPERQINISRPDLYFFENQGTVDYDSGYILSGSKVLTGKLYVWTDYTVESDSIFYKQVVRANGIDRNIKMPKCNKSKAYTLDFTLNYLW